MKTLLLTVFAFSAGILYCQMPRYYVYFISGEASIVSGKTETPLKAKQFLYPGTKLKIKNKGTSISLLGHDNYFIQLNKSGVYNVDQLQNLPKTKSNISVEFLKLIWHDLFQPTSRKETVTKALGAVRKDADDISIFPFNGSFLSADTIKFYWFRLDSTSRYQFTLYDSSKNELFSIITRDTILQLLKNSVLQNNQSSFYWNVLDLTGRISAIGKNKVTLLSAEEESRQITRIINDIPKSDDLFLYYLTLADILGKNGFQESAYQYYMLAMKN